MIQTKCASCGKAYQLADNAAGKKAKCKACGAVMTIPAGDDPLGLGGAPDPGKGDLSSLYGGSSTGDPVEPTAAPPAAFNPAVSFSNTPRRSAGPPMKLIIGLAGGAVGLIIIVILAVSLTGNGGGDDSKEDGPGGLALSGGAVPGGGGAQLPAGNGADGANTSDISPVKADELAKRFGAEQIELPEDDELQAWSRPALAGPEASTYKRVAFRGLDFQVPADWEVNYTGGREVFGSQLDHNAPPRIKELYDQARVLNLGALLFTTVSIRVAPRPTHDHWPPLYWVDETSGEMVLGSEITSFAMDSRKDWRDPNHSFIQRMREAIQSDPLRKKRSVGFAWAGPEAFFINRELVSDVQFGELFGGYRFVRIDGLDLLDRYRTVTYFGYVGDLVVTIQIEFQVGSPGNLEKVEPVIRRVRLLSEDDAQQLTQDDPGYQSWLHSGELKMAFRDDPVPLENVISLLRPSGDKSVVDISGRIVSPTGKPFGIDVPEGLEVVSTTRTAVRTRPLDDGTWLSMEIDKLAGLDRRQETPIDSESGTVLLHGHRVALPASAEVSELVSETFTIQRLLYPETPGQSVREVAYLMKSGAYLITITGRYPADKPEQLEAFDTAAKSVQVVPIEEEEDDGFKFEFDIKEEDDDSDEG